MESRLICAPPLWGYIRGVCVGLRVVRIGMIVSWTTDTTTSIGLWAGVGLRYVRMEIRVQVCQLRGVKRGRSDPLVRCEG